MRRRRRATADPLDAMPAELRMYDEKEWAAPGERPCAGGFASGDWVATWDHHRAHGRHCRALAARFAAHPEADCIEFGSQLAAGFGECHLVVGQLPGG